MKKLLVIFPEAFDQWGGYRLQKLIDSLVPYGWQTVAVAAPATSYRNMPHRVAPWSNIDTRVAWDLNPYVLGSRLKARTGGLHGLVRADGSTRATEGNAPGAGRGIASALRSASLRSLARLWPDYYTGWIPFAIARSLSVVRSERPDAMLSTYPPGAAHVVASAVHAASGVPWVADFRDPWAYASDFGYPAAHGSVARAFERRVIRAATEVSTVTESLSADFAGRYGRTVQTLPQGFVAAPRARPADRGAFDLQLAYTGTISEWVADIRPLVRVLRRLHSEGLHVVLRVMGISYDQDEDFDGAQQEGVLEMHPSGTRDAALDLIARSDVSVLIRSTPGRIWITTKLWDYLGAERPILALIDPESDAARIVTATRTGIVVPYDREDEIERALRDLISRRAEAELAWAPDGAVLADFELSAIGARLAEILDRITATPRSRRR